MSAKFLKTIIILSLIVVFSGIQIMPVFAQGGDSGFLQDCPIDDISDKCRPPTLQHFEFLFANLIVTAWALGGLVWMGYFINIARLYFTNDMNKIEEAKKKFGKWVLGFALYYLSWVIVGNVLSVMVGTSSSCYAEFSGNPVFRFFFAEVCTN